MRRVGRARTRCARAGPATPATIAAPLRRAVLVSVPRVREPGTGFGQIRSMFQSRNPGDSQMSIHCGRHRIGAVAVMAQQPLAQVGRAQRLARGANAGECAPRRDVRASVTTARTSPVGAPRRRARSSQPSLVPQTHRPARRRTARARGEHVRLSSTSRASAAPARRATTRRTRSGRRRARRSRPRASRSGSRATGEQPSESCRNTSVGRSARRGSAARSCARAARGRRSARSKIRVCVAIARGGGRPRRAARPEIDAPRLRGRAAPRPPRYPVALPASAHRARRTRCARGRRLRAHAGRTLPCAGARQPPSRPALRAHRRRVQREAQFAAHRRVRCVREQRRARRASAGARPRSSRAGRRRQRLPRGGAREVRRRDARVGSRRGGASRTPHADTSAPSANGAARLAQQRRRRPREHRAEPTITPPRGSAPA